MLEPKLITISGRPGSGKTTIGKMLAQELSTPDRKYAFIPEGFEECVYLPLFLKGEGFLKETELWFIEEDRKRHMEALELIEQGIGVVLDKPLIQNYEMIMSTKGFNSREERNFCRAKLLDSLMPLDKPHLFIDLQIGADLLNKSVSARGREMEAGMIAETGQMLIQQAHHEVALYTFYNDVPRVVVDRQKYDFVQNPENILVLKKEAISKLYS